MDDVRNNRNSGILLAAVSALVFSTAGLFTKGVEADSWTVIFWRGLFAVAFTAIYLAWSGKLRSEIAYTRLPAWFAAFVGACATAAFIAAFKHTSIANVALIYATAPFVAAAFTWILLKEKPTKAVLTASGLALAGVAIVVQGSIGSLNLLGDLLALAMVAGIALMLTVFRKYPETPAGTTNILSSIMLVIAVPLVSSPFQAPLIEIVILAAFGLIFAVASVTMVEGARRISPAETTLIGTLESPLAPIWAYLLFTEIPAIATIMGGAVILMAVFGWQFHTLRKETATRQ